MPDSKRHRRSLMAAVAVAVFSPVLAAQDSPLPSFQAFGWTSNAKQPSLEWRLEPPLPTSRYSVAAATAPDGSIYVMGGAMNTPPYYFNTVDVFLTRANRWIPGPSLPGPRVQMTAATGGDGRIYLIGGFNGQSQGFVGTVYALAPGSSQWTTVAPMPTARARAAAATGPDGRIYVAGGWNPNLTGPNPLDFTLDTLEIYNPRRNRWIKGASLPAPRYGLAIAALDDGRIYAIGGTVSLNATDTVFVYHPGRDAWTSAAPVPAPLRALAMAAVGTDGRIYLIGGCEFKKSPDGSIDCVDSKRVDVYTPWKNSWETIESTLAVHREGAVVASGRRIYALAGETAAVESAR